jgi:hypothetical protein
VRLFDHDFRTIFSRQINAPKLYLLDLLGEVVSDSRPSLRADLRASFASVRFALALLVAKMVRSSDLGASLFENPERWLPAQAEAVKSALGLIATDVVESVNFHIDQSEQENPTYDPKVAFKSQKGVASLEQDVLSHSRRQAARDRDYLFSLVPGQSA